jgi:3-deoxy-7-phosphoheptulonate synthase
VSTFSDIARSPWSELILQGNPDVHIIHRGGSKGPNYSAEFVKDTAAKLAKAGLPQRIMVSRI